VTNRSSSSAIPAVAASRTWSRPGWRIAGTPPTGLIMVDTYLSETVAKKGMTWLLPALLDGMLDRVDRYVLISATVQETCKNVS
jgi:hypothetical protein